MNDSMAPCLRILCRSAVDLNAPSDAYSTPRTSLCGAVTCAGRPAAAVDPRYRAPVYARRFISAAAADAGSTYH